MSSSSLTPRTEPAEQERHFPDITEKEEAFVWALLATGGQLTKSAIAAGYSKTSAHVSASRIVRKPAVIRAIREAGAVSLAGLIPQAIGQTAKLALRAKSEHVRLAASQDVLDRVGLAAPKQVRLGGQLSVVFDLG
jgi:phage terminase small subunit